MGVNCVLRSLTDHLLCAETDGSEGHSRPRSSSAGEEIQQPGAQEGDHSAAGGWGENSVYHIRNHSNTLSQNSSQE